MNFSPLVHRVAGDGAAAWDLHKRAQAARAAGEDVIVLSVGDMDLDTPEPIVEAGIAALRAGHTHYTRVIGEAPLRDAIAHHFATHGGWRADPANVCVVPGAQNALFAAALLLLTSGDEALMLEPGYVTYAATLGASGATPVTVGMPSETGFRPNLDAIAQAITPRSRALIVTNPNNPTGVVMTEAELAGIAALACHHDLWVISDEVYAGLCFEQLHHCIAGLPGMAERTVTVSSLSKSHAMTGWRVGWLIGPRALIRHAENLALCMLYGLPGFVQRAAVVALEQADSISGRTGEILRRRRELVVGGLSRIANLWVTPPQAGMFVMLDVRGTGLEGGDFARRLYDGWGVAVLDGTAFGPSAAGYVRLSFTANEQRLTEACARIQNFCASLRGGQEGKKVTGRSTGVHG